MMPITKKTKVTKDRHQRPVPENSSLDIPAKRFWENIEREELEFALNQIPDDRYLKFLSDLHNPVMARLTFSKILKNNKITLHEVQMIYTDHMRHMLLLRMSNKAPQLGSDVADDSLSQLILCPRCDGKKILIEVLERDDKGKILKTVDRDCPLCEKLGKIKVPGDKHARDLMYESLGLINVKGPLINSTHNNLNLSLSGPNPNSSVESLLKLTQSITTRRPELVPIETNTDPDIDLEGD